MVLQCFELVMCHIRTVEHKYHLCFYIYLYVGTYLQIINLIEHVLKPTIRGTQQQKITMLHYLCDLGHKTY